MIFLKIVENEEIHKQNVFSYNFLFGEKFKVLLPFNWKHIIELTEVRVDQIRLNRLNKTNVDRIEPNRTK